MVLQYDIYGLVCCDSENVFLQLSNQKNYYLSTPYTLIVH